MKTLICAARRTPIGSFQGTLSGLRAPQLGAQAIAAALADSKIDARQIQEVYMGCVLSAGIGQAPARQATLGAGLPNGVPSTTISKVCGSGLKAVALADLTIRSGEAEVVIAGGMESMSNAPYLLPKIREGLRMGPGALIDSMILDGLWDAYGNIHMGLAAEQCATDFQLSREFQDAFAIESYRRAVEAQKQKLFDAEITPLKITLKGKEVVILTDEEPSRGDPQKFASLKPAFSPNGTITAANASSLSDGAAALVLCSEAYAQKHDLKPLARIASQAQAAQEPLKYTTAPAPALERAVQKAGLQKNQIDLWEINEAFSAVALANTRLLDINPNQVNIAGGAVALGHPIGASGARILVTLVHSLQRTHKRWGGASLCIGGGEAVALVVENLS
jgi:acetyl-CoA C-acetyltransferase